MCVWRGVILGRESGRIKAGFISQVSESVTSKQRSDCPEEAALSGAFSWKLGVSCCKGV